VLGVDDELLKRSKRSIPRADVAELAVQGLSLSQAENRYFHEPLAVLYSAGLPLNNFHEPLCGCSDSDRYGSEALAECDAAYICLDCRSIDAISKDPGDGKPTTDFASLFGELKGDCNS